MAPELDPQTAAILEEIAGMVAKYAGADADQPARAFATDVFHRFAGGNAEGHRCSVEACRVGPNDMEVRVYRPEPRVAAPAAFALFFHGGGWSVGDLDCYDSLVRALSVESGLVFIAPEYRLAPEHPFPAALADCVQAARWACDQASALGLDETRFALAGDSAGGALAAAAIPLLADLRPKALALLYPMLDVASPDSAYPSRARYGDGRYFLTAAAIEAAARWWVGDDPAVRSDPRVSPLFIPDLRQFPPTLVLTAALDPLADEASAFVARLSEAGVQHSHEIRKQAIHAYLSFGVLPQAVQDRAAVGRWLRESLGP